MKEVEENRRIERENESFQKFGCESSFQRVIFFHLDSIILESIYENEKAKRMH